MDRDFVCLNRKIIACRRCPRLVAFRENVPFRKGLKEEKGWRKPVPGFGDPRAWLLILGLAPSVEGANRTGRIFTGDGSARFLIKALYQGGFATQPFSESIDDGLQLKGCYLTAAVKCVPPQHRPLKEESLNCSGYLENEFFLLTHLRAVLALGQLAFESFQAFLIKEGVLNKREPFAHACEVKSPGWPTLFGAYHPSPQNTNTGKLTEEMFLSLLQQIRTSCAPEKS
jgi:uracil-DNA glycosylase